MNLSTSVPELREHVAPSGDMGQYLTQIVEAGFDDSRGRAKVIWDLSAVAWLVEPSWVPTVLTTSPLLNDNLTWSHDRGRHLIRVATRCERDPIFRDLFDKLRTRG